MVQVCRDTCEKIKRKEITVLKIVSNVVGVACIYDRINEVDVDSKLSIITQKAHNVPI